VAGEIFGCGVTFIRHTACPYGYLFFGLA